MYFSAYRLSDGQFLRTWPNPPPFDTATEALSVYPEHLRPNHRTERFDAGSETKKRDATAQEIADYDAERLNAVVDAEFDGLKTLKAVVLWICQREGIAPAQARTEILTIRRSL